MIIKLLPHVFNVGNALNVKCELLQFSRPTIISIQHRLRAIASKDSKKSSFEVGGPNKIFEID
jgi:hypothetical protein